jgi:hypothetical protein
MELPGTPYQRVKWLTAIYLISFILYFIQFILSAPTSEAEPTFSTYPVATTALYILGIFIFLGLPVTGYYISKDKRMLAGRLGARLNQHWPIATQSQALSTLFRHPLTTIVLTYLTTGFYPLYYVLLRWRFNSQTDDIDSIGGQRKEAEQTFEQAKQAARDEEGSAQQSASAGAGSRTRAQEQHPPQERSQPEKTSPSSSETSGLSRRQMLGTGVLAGSGIAVLVWQLVFPVEPYRDDWPSLTVNVTSGSTINESSNESLEFTVVNDDGEPVQEVEKVVLEPDTVQGETHTVQLSADEANATVSNFIGKTNAELAPNQHVGTYVIRPVDEADEYYDVKRKKVTIIDN